MINFIKDPALKKLLRVVPEKTFLFKQGERGNTMYIIIEGCIQLTQRTSKQIRVVESLTSGDFLGEKAILSDEPHRWSYSAEATKEAAVLEFDHRFLQGMQIKVPDFTMQVLRVLSQRLDRASDLIGVLLLDEEADRLVHFLAYHARNHSTTTPPGKQFLISTKLIQTNTNLDLDYIEKSLKLLVEKNILSRSGETFTLLDEAALLESAIPLKALAAA